MDLIQTCVPEESNHAAGVSTIEKLNDNTTLVPNYKDWPHWRQSTWWLTKYILYIVSDEQL